MATGFSSTTANAMLDSVTTWYVRLHTGDPGASGTANGSANSTRSLLTLAAASGGSRSLTSTAPSWSSWASGSETLTHVSFWSASSGGTFQGSAALSASKSITNGDSLTLSAATVAISSIAA